MVTIPEFYELKFEENTHTYTIDGIELPSVTTIMEPLKNRSYSGISESVMEKAAQRGSDVHNSIENYIKFDIIDIPDEYKGYFDAYLKWWNTFHPEVIASEAKVYHKLLRYAGTIDLVLNINNEIVLVDIKTTATLKEDLCGVQLEGYYQALKSHGILVDKKAILHLSSDGEYKFVMFPSADAMRWRVFTALKTIFDYK